MGDRIFPKNERSLPLFSFTIRLKVNQDITITIKRTISGSEKWLEKFDKYLKDKGEGFRSKFLLKFIDKKLKESSIKEGINSIIESSEIIKSTKEFIKEEIDDFNKEFDSSLGIGKNKFSEFMVFELDKEMEKFYDKKKN